MQQDVIYPNQPIVQPMAQRRFQICGLMDMSYGGPLVCFLWIVINMYACVLSFQSRSPIYSYLNHAALIVQGVVCLWFVISALISLYSFTLNMPKQLRRSHRLTWSIVIVFLIVYFVNLIIFCVQKDQFNGWCLSRSRTDTVNTLSTALSNSTTFVSNNITSFNSSQVTAFLPIYPGSDIYNCARLWEDEIKFSVVVFVILFVLYIHFAFCFWCYTQDRMLLHDQIYDAFNNQNFNNPNMMMGNNNMMMSNNPNMMMNNIKPGGNYNVVEEKRGSEQKSLAQITRAMFGRLR